MTLESFHFKYIWFGVSLHKHNPGKFALFVKGQNSPSSGKALCNFSHQIPKADAS